MPGERLSMRKIREVLRLRFAQGLSQRAIGISLRLSTGAVNTYLNRARRAGLGWPLPDGLDDAQLETLLSVVTDGLCSYPAAMKEIGNADRQEAGRRLNNRAENSHQPFRRRERAMQRFRSMKTLQKFSSVHAQVHNHFNQERHLVTRQVYKQRRSAALAEWSALAA